MADPEEGVEQLAADLAARTVLETQETPAEIESDQNTEIAVFCITPEVQDFVDRHSESGVLDRDGFTSLLGLTDQEGNFMVELVSIFKEQMDEYFTKAAAWIQKLPDIPEHERKERGQPNRLASLWVYDDFNIRAPAAATVREMGAARLKTTLLELRAQKHAYDRQRCREAFPATELAYTEFKGVLDEFVQRFTRPRRAGLYCEEPSTQAILAAYHGG
eukprot:TRINITY_DN697_c0_g1_i1.p1 TRINITY_DN697_c0_g1~~TRINITY_DN697_c0_g1_i1.p1  ORF type:complete len:218 (-),score=21.12 TRINITY_DN697_c0_g1_i1:183-836(-)